MNPNIQRPASMTEPLPRYRVLTICIRAAIAVGGWENPTVKHMVERNEMLNLAKHSGVI